MFRIVVAHVWRRMFVNSVVGNSFPRKHIMEIVYFSFHDNQNNAIASECVNNNGHRCHLDVRTESDPIAIGQL